MRKGEERGRKRPEVQVGKLYGYPNPTELPDSAKKRKREKGKKRDWKRQRKYFIDPRRIFNLSIVARRREKKKKGEGRKGGVLCGEASRSNFPFCAIPHALKHLKKRGKREERRGERIKK